MDQSRSNKNKTELNIKGAYDHLKETSNKPSVSNNGSTPGLVKIFFVGILIFVLLTGLGIFSPTNNGIFDNSDDDQYNQNENDYNQRDSNSLTISAILYSSPTCGCCHNYVTIMNENGFDVFQKRTEDYLDIKDENNIPKDHRSCHTMIVESYFIEGHIPADIVVELLNSNPDIDGIALAGMPSGSPGMSGEKTSTWNIYSIADGSAISIFRSV